MTPTPTTPGERERFETALDEIERLASACPWMTPGELGLAMARIVEAVGRARAALTTQTRPSSLGASPSGTALSAPAPSGRPLQSHGAERLELLHRFLNAAASEGFEFDGVDAADLYVALFPETANEETAGAKNEAEPEESNEKKRVLLQQAQRQLMKWADWYGKECGLRPLSLPPAGDILLLERIDDELARGIVSGEAGQTPQAAGPEGQEPGPSGRAQQVGGGSSDE